MPYIYNYLIWFVMEYLQLHKHIVQLKLKFNSNKFGLDFKNYILFFNFLFPNSNF